MQRVLFIHGIRNRPIYSKGWQTDLAAHFGAENVHMFTDFYMHTDHTVCERHVQSLVSIANDYKPTVIIGHSFGGMLAKALIARQTMPTLHTLVTMASPHGLELLGVQACKDFLCIPKTVVVPHMYSFGGLLDPIVPYMYSELPNATHTNLPVEHMAFVLSAEVRKQVLQKSSLL